MGRDAQVLLTVSDVADTCAIGRGLVLAWSASQTVELGRSPECALHLPDATVSRFHVRLTARGGQRFVEALTENNGTFLDGEALVLGKPALLSAGARLQVGGVLMDVQVLHATVPVVDQLRVGADSEAQQESELLFRVMWDADNCVVSLNGQHLDLPPMAAKALAVLVESAGDVVHQWDLLEFVGEGANLAQVFSQVRSGLLASVEQGDLSLDLLRDRVRCHSSGPHCAQLDEMDARGVLRHFVASRRGHGYRICVARSDVVVHRA